jgi:hypothetical protein
MGGTGQDLEAASSRRLAMRPQATTDTLVSEAVREIRSRLHMGLGRFARLVRSNPTSIERCEKGKRGLRRDVVQRICEAASSHGMADVAEILGAEVLFTRQWDTARKAKPVEFRNRLIVVGFTGLQRCYLNTSRAEAVKRWSKEAGMEPEDKDVHEIPFDDEFRVHSFFDDKVEASVQGDLKGW